MFSHQGIWLPDGEAHLPEWMDKHGEIVDGKGTYQIKKIRAALEHVKQFRVAIDVGAHVGLWTMRLRKRFEVVHAFEPVAAHRECFNRNVKTLGEEDCVVLYPCALGPGSGYVSLSRNPASSGDTFVDRASDVEMSGMVELWTLDSFGLKDVDFIKIDVEGWEDRVIVGARDTIERCWPAIIVEQKPHRLSKNYGVTGTPAVDLLKSFGYSVAREMGGDYIMVPK